MRVGIIALLQESNTFLSQPTTLEHFRQNLLMTGPGIRAELQDSHHEVGGFFAGLDSADIEAVPIFATRAMPFGTVTTETIETLFEMMFREVSTAGEMDGYLIAPHGATVSEKYPDADGAWLSRLRETVGPKKPIISTADPHANLSPAMVAATDAIISYRSNPHIDQRARGLEAAAMMERTLQQEIVPTQAAAFPPVAISIESQHTSAPPCLPFYEEAARIRELPGVLSCSIFLGFPYADVEEMGSAIVVVTDNQPELAREKVAELEQYLWEHREEFAGEFTGIDAAIYKALDMSGPVCLLDMGDNVGGGSPADGTLIAEALHQRKVPQSFVCLYDPEAVGQALAAGIGSRAKLSVGGKSDNLHGKPLEAEFAILSEHDGKFSESKPRHGGWTEFDQGQTVVLRTDDDLTVMLTSERMVPFSLEQLRSCGLKPADYKILIAKGVNAPLAAYEEVCPGFIRVNTPGVTTADMTQLNFQRRRNPMFPFERDFSYVGAES